MRLSLKIFGFLAVLALLWQLFVVLGSKEMAADLAVFEVAAKRISAGEEIYVHAYNEDVANVIYSGNPPKEVWFDLHYLYPPFFAAALNLVMSESHQATKHAFCVLTFFLLCLSAFFVSALLRNSLVGSLSLLSRMIGVLLLFFVTDSFYVTVAEGQVNILILFLILLFIVCLEKRKFSFSGVFLVWAALIKFSPFLLFLGPARGKRFEVFCGALIGAMVAGTLLLFVPYAGYQNFFSQFWTLTGGAMEEGVLNMSLQKILLGFLGLQHSEAARILYKGLVFLIAGGLTLNLNPKESRYPLCSSSLLIILMILASPITWSHHLVLLVIPFSALLLGNGRISNPMPRYTLCAAYILIFSRVYLIQQYIHTGNRALLPFYYLFLNCALILCAFILFKDAKMRQEAHV